VGKKRTTLPDLMNCIVRVRMKLRRKRVGSKVRSCAAGQYKRRFHRLRDARFACFGFVVQIDHPGTYSIGHDLTSTRSGQRPDLASFAWSGCFIREFSRLSVPSPPLIRTARRRRSPSHALTHQSLPPSPRTCAQHRLGLVGVRLCMSHVLALPPDAACIDLIYVSPTPRGGWDLRRPRGAFRMVFAGARSLRFDSPLHAPHRCATGRGDSNVCRSTMCACGNAMPMRLVGRFCARGPALLANWVCQC
jgi:hypothetical protein